MEHVDEMDVFEELFVQIFFTLKEMSLNLERKYNPNTSSQATSFSALISSFQFIVALVITRNILDMTLLPSYYRPRIMIYWMVWN